MQDFALLCIICSEKAFRYLLNEYKIHSTMNVINSPLISIIVPIYNVKPYLSRCLESICAQTYRHLDIVVVDDGSTDGGSAVCDSFARRDARVRVLHFENSGVSAARNRGLAAARGELIGWVDGDDWLEPCFVERLYTVLATHNADIACCSYFDEKDGQTIARCENGTIYTWNANESMAELLRDTLQRNYFWNKLFRRNVLEGIICPTGRCYEDISTMYLCVAKARRVIFIGEPLYHYVHHDGSIVHYKFHDITKEMQVFQAMFERTMFLLTYDKKLWLKSLNKTLHKGIRLVNHTIIDRPDDEHVRSIREFGVNSLSAISLSNARFDLSVKAFIIIHLLFLYAPTYRIFRYVFKSKLKFQTQQTASKSKTGFPALRNSPFGTLKQPVSA